MTNAFSSSTSLDLAVITVKARGSAKELLQEIGLGNPTENSVLIHDETSGLSTRHTFGIGGMVELAEE